VPAPGSGRRTTRTASGVDLIWTWTWTWTWTCVRSSSITIDQVSGGIDSSPGAPRTLRARFVLTTRGVQPSPPQFDVAAASRFDTSSTARSFIVRSTAGRYVQLTPSAMLLLTLRDQRLSPAEIAVQLSATSGSELSTEDIERGLARIDAQLAEVAATKTSSGFLFELPLLPARVVVLIARLLAPLFHPLTAALLTILAVAIVAGLYATRGLPVITADGALIGFGLALATLLVHEFGHAAACARYGAAPSAIGFTVYVVYPAFYSDVTSAWTLSRRQRLVVDVGGFYFQAIAIAVIAVGFVVTGWAPLHVCTWMALGTFSLSLNPMFKFDGYWLISDLLGVANLATERTRILRHYWDRLRGRETAPLPWPRRIRILLAPYTIISFGFFGWFLWTATPVLARLVVGYPQALVDFVAAASRPGGPAAMEVLSLVVTTLMTFFAALFFRQVGRWAVCGARWLARRLQPVGSR